MLFAGEVGASFGRVAQLHGGHDAEGAGDLPVAGAGQPVSDLVARRGSIGAMRFQEANRSRAFISRPTRPPLSMPRAIPLPPITPTADPATSSAAG